MALQQPPAMAGRAPDLQAQARGLDQANQQLQAQLAQEQQKEAQLQSALQSSQQQVASLQTEVERARSSNAQLARSNKATRASPTTFNNSAPLSTVKIPGAEVVQDGELIRIRVETSALFSSGKADLKSSVNNVLDDVASVLKSQYAGQVVGIEGHTDADPITKSKWRSNHELAVARSVSVFQALKKKGVPESQLFVAGFGPNQPLADNKSSKSKAQNRRVEIVIYPRTAQ